MSALDVVFFSYFGIMNKELLLSILNRVLEEIKQWELNDPMYAIWYEKCIEDVTFFIENKKEF